MHGFYVIPMKAYAIGMFLAITTLFDAALSFIGSKNNWANEAQPLVAMVIGNFWLVLIAMWFLTCIYIVWVYLLGLKYLKFRTNYHWYVSWMGIGHILGGFTWVIAWLR